MLVSLGSSHDSATLLCENDVTSRPAGASGGSGLSLGRAQAQVLLSSHNDPGNEG